MKDIITIEDLHPNHEECQSLTDNIQKNLNSIIADLEKLELLDPNSAKAIEYLLFNRKEGD